MSTSPLQGQPPSPKTPQNVSANDKQAVQGTVDLHSACQTCTNPINSEMICCNLCHSKFHKNCAKPSALLANMDWQCQACLSTSTNGSPLAEAVGSGASNISTGSQSRRAALDLQRAEEERMLALAELAINKEFLRKKYNILVGECEERENKSSHSDSVRAWLDRQQEFANSNSTVIPIPQKIPHINSENQRDDATTSRSLTQDGTIKNTNSGEPLLQGDSVRFSVSNPPGATSETITTTVSNSLPVISQATSGSISTQACKPSITTNVNNITAGVSIAGRSSTLNANSTFRNIPAGLLYSGCSLEPQSGPNQQRYSSSLPNAASTHIYTDPNTYSFPPIAAPTQIQQPDLTKEQIHARQSVPKELPIFSGHPEEWPVFSSTFDWSTAVCGLTDAENLLRLQRSLRGDALHSVQHILVHPTCVPAAISTLKLLFGQPEKILHSIKTRIKSTPPINTNKLETFTTFAVNVKGLIATIEACGLQDELSNSSLLQELVEKLPTQYQLIWGTYKLELLKINQRPNLLAFSNWIFDFGLSASSVTVTANTVLRSDNNNTTKKAFIHTHSEEQRKKCCVCKLSCKNVASCEYFQKADRSERWKIVRKHNLCKQCLYPHASTCKNKKTCSVNGCLYNHHALLHRFFSEERTHDEGDGEAQTEISVNAHSEKNFKTLFKVVPISVFGRNKVINTFAFIDEGSSVSLCDEELASELKLKGVPHPLCLNWTGHIQRTENASQRIVLTIAGASGKQTVLEVHTVRKLSLPVQSLNYEELSERFPHLRNLPICSYNNATPRLLIGANNWSLGVSKEIRENKPSDPAAVRTQLGWLIYGGGKNCEESFNLHICECFNDTSLHHMVKNYFSIECLGVMVSREERTVDEVRGMELLKKYTKRRADKHFETCMLWRSDEFILPESYPMAKNRLMCLERKLKSHPELLEVFKNTINEYLSKGYIRKLSDCENEAIKINKVWYLPIFAVFNKNKPGKVRVVWDAAAKSQGVSLNSLLLKGPDLLASLPAILFRFREKAIAVCGDIEQMFHQIFIRQEDQDVQRFLWRDCDDNKSPDVYVMNVMIFGASCAPSTSQFVKNLNASEFEEQFPDATKAIKEDHYVDDFLKSVDTVAEAKKMVADVRYVHKQGGFNIRNWMSNSEEVLQSIEQDNCVKEKSLALSKETAVEKVLGIFWIPSEDMITFKISEAVLQNYMTLDKRPPTKREMLRLLMSTYDPLGLIGNFLMYVKIILQEVWRSGVDWNEPILGAQAVKWSYWVRFLPDLQNIRIPRSHLGIFPTYDDIDIQLHTFVDASENGYAAVCYLRLSDGQNVSCSLIGSKTRVAPLKIVSIPRLELMAAVVGTRFAKFVKESHSIVIGRQHYWSDSRTVLSWLRAADHRRYHQFVAFRVGEILDTTVLQEWRWVPSKLNVADEATKWAKAPDISQSSRWFNGPQFLQQPEVNWPTEEANISSTEVELKHQVLCISVKRPLINAQRFGTWMFLMRAVAYVFRYTGNLRRKKSQSQLCSGELTQSELQKAEILILSQAQHEEYAASIHDLLSGKRLKRSNVLYRLSPYIDENNLLRVDGRIDSVYVPGMQTQPIILPRNNAITNLILMHFHQLHHHSNHETAINELRQRFYVSHLRTAYRKEVKHCQRCKIDKAMPCAPQMAKLPYARLASFVAPFTFTGLDFFGPITVTVGRHTEKRYGALFTCLTVRAVHVEIVYSLNTSSCILAIRNFMARRGIPREFYSDNGTNFVGAERELREALKEVDENELVRNFTTTITKWNFNPPSAPHMGGAWERLVRSIKTVLYKIMPSRPPGDELLRSMLAEVENIVNARPLAYVPLENNTAEALTPNHFLLGSSNGIKPMATYDDSGVVLKSSWLISQQYADSFWRRWLVEYLPSLTRRTKWHEKTKPLCLGDLVLVVDPKCPRNVWPRGKVVEVKVAKDGQVRSAKILTAHGILERPAMKLAVLDVATRTE